MVFKRNEKKYLLTEAQYRQLRKNIGYKIKPDRFPSGLVCNIYYDTPSYELIRRSIEKPLYKEKLRLRSYGVPEEGSMVFAEIKKKSMGVVYKRRISMNYNEAVNFLSGGFPPQETQITKEISWMLGHYESLAPSMFLSYERLAFAGCEDHSLRITFDNSITYRNTDLALTEGVWGYKLLEPTTRLMEIKFTGGMSVWLARALSQLEIYPTSFSKYGRAYQRLLCSNNKTILGGLHCA